MKSEENSNTTSSLDKPKFASFNFLKNLSQDAKNKITNNLINKIKEFSLDPNPETTEIIKLNNPLQLIKKNSLNLNPQKINSPNTYKNSNNTLTNENILNIKNNSPNNIFKNNLQNKTLIFTNINNSTKYNISKNLTMNDFTNLSKLNSELNLYSEANRTNSNFKSGFGTFYKTKNNSFRNNSNNNLTQNKTKNNFFKKNLDLNLFPLDKFNTLITDTMTNYRTESMTLDADETQHQQDNSNYNRRNGIFTRGNFFKFAQAENSFIKIDVKNKDYKNPEDSQKIINKNKIIYKNITNSSINLQRLYYDKTIDDITKVEKYYKKMPKIRISNLFPKTINNFIGDSRNNNNSQNFEKKNNFLSEDLAEKDIDDVLNKDKDKSHKKENKKIKKNEGINLKNIIIRSGEVELYAYYKNSTKDFPEGREQFIFDNNLIDIALFGGIVTNKNNNVWTLDPSNLRKNNYKFLFFI